MPSIERGSQDRFISINGLNVLDPIPSVGETVAKYCAAAEERFQETVKLQGEVAGLLREPIAFRRAK